MKRLLPLVLPVLMLPMLMLAGCISQAVEPVDKASFITPTDLVPLGYTNPNMPEGTWSKTQYSSKSYDVDYEVETPESEENYPLYINETLSQEESSTEAIAFLAATRGTLNLSLKSEGLTEVSVPNQIIYGDGSNLTILKKDNVVVGNIFSARKGKRSFSIMLVGTMFEDAKEWDDFAAKKVNSWLNGTK